MDDPILDPGQPEPAPGERHLLIVGLTPADRQALGAAVELARQALGGTSAEMTQIAAAIDEVVRVREAGAFPALLLGSAISDERAERTARTLSDASGTAPVVRWRTQADEPTLERLLVAGCCDVLDHRRCAPDDLLRGLRLAFEISRRRRAELLLAHPRPERDLAGELEAAARRYVGTGRLLLSISHDLNNLLQPLAGYIELLAEETAPETETAEILGAMQRATQVAESLVQRMLLLGRNADVTRLRIAPDRVVESLEALVRSIAGARVRLDVVLAAPGARISLPAGALEQIVLNLVANARDAMPAGGTLTLRSRRLPGSWSLEVEDTGSGVEGADTARLFESGFTTKGAGGAGLGLWIVRTLIQDAGGSVELAGMPLRGTRATVLIPLAGE